MSDRAYQQQGLTQNQPGITPPTINTPGARAMAMNQVGAGGGTSAYGDMTAAELIGRVTGRQPKPQVPVEQPEPFIPNQQLGNNQNIPPNAYNQPLGNAPPSQGLPQSTQSSSFLQGVQSREQRAFTDNMQSVDADLVARGLATSPVGGKLSTTGRADLSQRMNENISSAAYDDWKFNNQMDQANRDRASAEQQAALGRTFTGSQNDLNRQHETSLTRLRTDEELRGLAGRIPLDNQAAQTGIDLYNRNFPGGATAGGGGGNIRAGSPGGESLQDLNARANAESIAQREAMLNGGSGGGMPNPTGGVGSSPGNPIGGSGNEDPDFGYSSGPMGRNGSRTRGPSSGGATTPSSAGVNPTRPAGWSPQTSGAGQNMSPASERYGVNPQNRGAGAVSGAVAGVNPGGGAPQGYNTPSVFRSATTSGRALGVPY